MEKLPERSTLLDKLKKFFQSYYREMKTRMPNLPGVLILLYSIPISMSMTIGQTVIFSFFTKPTVPSCYETIPVVELDNVYKARLVENMFLFLAYPISGWLADVKIGRGLSIKVSLWLCWSGMLVLTTSYLVQYSECGLLYVVFKYPISLLGLVLLMLGMANFHTNALAYMIDHMPEASTSQIRSTIRWFTWTLLLGFGCDYIEVLRETKLNHTVVVGTFVATFVWLSSLLFVHQFTSTFFLASKPIKQSPYKLMLNVLYFAWKNNKAVNRSSLTFWEDKTPSRIDLGKQRYGGPFKEDEVENVKSFAKVVVIFALLGGIFIPYFDLANQGTIHGSQYEGADSLAGYSSYILWQTFVMSGVVLVPLVELVVIPLFPKFEFFITSPLKGLIVAHALAIAALLVFFGLRLYIFFKNEDKHLCYMLLQSTKNTFSVSYFFLVLPCSFIGIYVYLTFNESFQVICSQAPHEMSGMLMGVFWFTRALFISIGALLSYLVPLFLEQHINVNLPGCRFWIFLALLIVTCCGLILFIVFVHLCSNRERGTVFNTQQVIENHYMKYLDARSYYGNPIINDQPVKLTGWSDNIIPHD